MTNLSILSIFKTEFELIQEEGNFNRIAYLFSITNSSIHSFTITYIFIIGATEGANKGVN